MTNKEINLLTAKCILSETIGTKVLHKELIPTSIFNSTIDFLNGGCKSRADYENMILFYMNNTYYRNLLMEE